MAANKKKTSGGKKDVASLLFRKTPEAYLAEAIKATQIACLGQQAFHLSHEFTGAKNQSALVVCFVTCKDELAHEMHTVLDDAVQETFAKHGLVASTKGEVQ